MTIDFKVFNILEKSGDTSRFTIKTIPSAFRLWSVQRAMERGVDFERSKIAQNYISVINDTSGGQLKRMGTSKCPTPRVM